MAERSAGERWLGVPTPVGGTNVGAPPQTPRASEYRGSAPNPVGETSVGAPPQTPERVLFEKSALSSRKNFD